MYSICLKIGDICNPMLQELIKTVLKDSANLKAYYRFESGALLTDSSGNGKTLTAINSAAGGTGLFGDGLDLGAANTNKCLRTTASLGITGNGAYTFVFWVKLNAEIASGIWRFINFYSNFTTSRYANITYEYNGGTRRLIFDAAGTTNTYTVTLGTSGWHQIAITSDATTARLYVDGNFVSSGSLGSTGTGTDDLTIGAADNNSQASSAIFDDFAAFNISLSADQIKELYEGRLLGELWPQANLLASYHLSNVNDYSGNNLHLTNTNTVTFLAGNLAKYAHFVGASSQSLNIASATLRVNGTKTMMAWIKLANTTDQHKYPLAICDAAATNNFRIRQYQTDLFADYDPLTNSGNAIKAGLSAGVWYHIAIVYDTATGKTYHYFNGNKTAEYTVTGSPNFSSTEFSIGRNGQVAGGYFSGDIDEVAFFNIALSSQQIRKIYARQLGKFL
jgi:concanavalin A-like lectin/glucanase superfamily protein